MSQYNAPKRVTRRVLKNLTDALTGAFDDETAMHVDAGYEALLLGTPWLGASMEQLGIDDWETLQEFLALFGGDGGVLVRNERNLPRAILHTLSSADPQIEPLICELFERAEQELRVIDAIGTAGSDDDDAAADSTSTDTDNDIMAQLAVARSGTVSALKRLSVILQEEDPTIRRHRQSEESQMQPSQGNQQSKEEADADPKQKHRRTSSAAKKRQRVDYS